jgi:hypothetical protein
MLLHPSKQKVITWGYEQEVRRVVALFWMKMSCFSSSSCFWCKAGSPWLCNAISKHAICHFQSAVIHDSIHCQNVIKKCISPPLPTLVAGGGQQHAEYGLTYAESTLPSYSTSAVTNVHMCSQALHMHIPHVPHKCLLLTRHVGEGRICYNSLLSIMALTNIEQIHTMGGWISLRIPLVGYDYSCMMFFPTTHGI